MSIGVLFVCLGNICRSPTAHGVFQQQVMQRGLTQKIMVDSAGTGDWHIGRAPDQRSAAAALRRGYDLSELRARQVTRDDFFNFDYILAMDNENLRNLQQLRPADFKGELKLFLDYSSNNSSSTDSLSAHREVPDPYYGDKENFELVIDLVEQAATGLLDAIVARHRLV